jgi:hypothetical protein
VAERMVKRLLCRGFLRTDKAMMGQVYQCLVEDMSRNKCFFFSISNLMCFTFYIFDLFTDFPSYVVKKSILYGALIK